MKISQAVIKLIVYAHENGLDIIELEVAESGEIEAATIKDPERKKAVKKPRKKVAPVSYEGTISDKEVKEIRAQLAIANVTGLLDENQKAAISEMKGTHAKNLSEAQRKQLKEIYEEVRE